MSRVNDLSGALVKREIETALREAGLSRKDTKTAVSIFCRYLDQAPAVDRRGIFGKIFTKLKRFHKSTGGPEGIRVYCGG